MSTFLPSLFAVLYCSVVHLYVSLAINLVHHYNIKKIVWLYARNIIDICAFVDSSLRGCPLRPSPRTASLSCGKTDTSCAQHHRFDISLAEFTIITSSHVRPVSTSSSTASLHSNCYETYYPTCCGIFSCVSDDSGHAGNFIRQHEKNIIKS
jgi:hypothetical protein